MVSTHPGLPPQVSPSRSIYKSLESALLIFYDALGDVDFPQ